MKDDGYGSDRLLDHPRASNGIAVVRMESRL